MPLYLCFPLLVVLLRPALCAYNCSSVYQRTPVSSDLLVDCGADVITLDVNLCTAQWAGFNITDLALNGNRINAQCQGSVITSVDPPIIRFQLPVNSSQDNPCRESLQIVSEAPDPAGLFSSFLNIQSVIIRGFINTPRSDQGFISYSTDLYYRFSCQYPLEYLLNNTQIVASSSSVAAKDNNGTFVNSLKMTVFNDSDFVYPLEIPSTGLELRKKVYVEVSAVNFTGNLYVLLDHCFGTPTPYNVTNAETHNFFIGCTTDPKTVVTSNGVSKSARFNFEAFRFVQHRDQAKSSTYLHCIVRLCEPRNCQQLLAPCTNRRKRSVTTFGEQTTDSATVMAGPIYTGPEDTPQAAGNTGNSVAAGRSALLSVGGWIALKTFYWIW